MTGDDVGPAPCGAKTRNGGACKRFPAPGATRCRFHGAGTPQARQKAAQRVLTTRLHSEVERRGWQPVTNPALLLADVAGEAEAFKDAARAKLNELDTWESHNQIGTETVKAVVAVYAAALRDVAGVAEKLWRLGIDHTALKLETERPTREQAATLHRITQRAVEAAYLDADQTQRFRDALIEGVRLETGL